MFGGKSFRLIKRFFIAAACVAATLPAAAYANQALGNAQLELVTPLSFISVDDLDFGRLIPSSTAGTVVLTPAGVRTANNGIVLVGSDFQTAAFAGQGTFNQRVDVSLGSNSIFITGPGAPMLVNTFVIGSSPTAILTTNPRRFRIGAANGIFRFPVGATLNVGANQAAGVYTGIWTITLQYQ